MSLSVPGHELHSRWLTIEVVHALCMLYRCQATHTVVWSQNNTGYCRLVYRCGKKNKKLFLTPCRRAKQKCVITVPCVVDGSRISAFFYATSCTCVSHLVWLTYRFKVIASLMQDAWVSSYKQTDRYWPPIFRTIRLQQRHHSFRCSQRSGEKVM